MQAAEIAAIEEAPREAYEGRDDKRGDGRGTVERLDCLQANDEKRCRPLE